jgi:hypothetical protein
MYVQVLEFEPEGVIRYSSGLTLGSAVDRLLSEEDDETTSWRYQAGKDSLTLLGGLYGGEYCRDDGISYPFTLAEDELTFGDALEGDIRGGEGDICFEDLSGTAWSRQTTWARGTSTPQQWASVLAAQEAAIRPSLVALDDAFEAKGAWVALQDAWDAAGYGEIDASVEEIQRAASVVHGTASAMTTSPPQSRSSVSLPPKSALSSMPLSSRAKRSRRQRATWRSWTSVTTTTAPMPPLI